MTDDKNTEKNEEREALPEERSVPSENPSAETPPKDVSASESEAHTENADSPSSDPEKAAEAVLKSSAVSESPESTYAFRWDYRTQYEQERERKKTVRIRAGLLYTLLVAAIFAVAFAILAIVLAAGSGRTLSGLTTGTIPDTYSERVVYVNGQGDAEEALAVEAAVAKMLPSTVSILVTKNTGTSGVGSGVVFSEDGYLVTNYHVVEDAEKISARLYGGARYDAQVVGYDEATDLALLKIDATGLTPAVFGDSDQLLVGETVMAIGTPTGITYAETVTRGIVSCKTRAVKVYQADGKLSHTLLMVQTDASVNPGNSGGPLLNRNGEVIGIIANKTIFYHDGTAYYADGMGLAIPSSAVKTIVTALAEGEEPDRTGFLIAAARFGISGKAVTAMESGASADGVRVESITSVRFDAYNKLKLGDIIYEVNGVAVGSISALLSSIEDYMPGTAVRLKVFRNGASVEVDLILGSDALA